MKTKEQVNNKTQCKPAPNTESKQFNTKWMATWTHCEANPSKSKRGGNHYVKELHLLFGLYYFVKTCNNYRHLNNPLQRGLKLIKLDPPPS
jgi:hypothetical protein